MAPQPSQTPQPYDGSYINHIFNYASDISGNLQDLLEVIDFDITSSNSGQSHTPHTTHQISGTHKDSFTNLVEPLTTINDMKHKVSHNKTGKHLKTRDLNNSTKHVSASTKDLSDLNNKNSEADKDITKTVSANTPEASQTATINYVANINDIKTDLEKIKRDSLLQQVNSNELASENLVNTLTLANMTDANIVQATQQHQDMQSELTAQQRLAEINTYYAKEYEAQAGVMKVLVYTCILLLIVVLLKKYKFLPSTVSSILSFIIFIAGLIIFLLHVNDISQRSNMNFDEYTFEILEGERAPVDGVSVWDYDKTQIKNLWTDTKDGITNDYNTANSDVSSTVTSVKTTANNDLANNTNANTNGNTNANGNATANGNTNSIDNLL